MYSELYKAWKSEKTNIVPQPLPSDFYQRATAFVKNLEDELSSADTNTLQTRLLAREMNISKRLLNDLKQARLHKIISGVQSHIPIQTGNLIEEEIALNANISQSLSSLIQEHQQLAQDNSANPLTTVRFLQDIPEIVGVDLKIYGPFNKEDVASLPLANAQALEKQGAVKAVEVKNVS
ncbi:MAG TPA: hypothetical protein VJZ03_00685 [Candidatus Bathyarchaeia archaeon]|nr:hypothetical protein [Candidatus Bathyarchaeia archaeon]